jgi:hypothetical protein
MRNVIWRAMRMLGTMSLLAFFLLGCGSKDNCGGEKVVLSDYYPIHTGDIWTYDTRTVQVLDEFRNYSTGIGQRIEKGGGNHTDTFVGFDQEGRLTTYGTYDSEHKEYLDFYNPFIFPKEMQVCDSWESLITSIGDKMWGSFIGWDTVTVPAGTFSECIKIKTGIKEEDGKSFATISWAAKDVGTVKIELVEESPPGYSGIDPLVKLQSATVGLVSYPQ